MKWNEMQTLLKQSKQNKQTKQTKQTIKQTNKQNIINYSWQIYYLFDSHTLNIQFWMKNKLNDIKS